MNFFKKLLSKKDNQEVENSIKFEESATLEQNFVKQFIHKGGKFLYSTSTSELIEQLNNIIQENEWFSIDCISKEITKMCTPINIKTSNSLSNTQPFLTPCECLIAVNGSILLSSNQLQNKKIHELNNNFIVFAKTSQIVKSTGDSLSKIKQVYQKELPTNISAIKNFTPNKSSDNFMTYGNNNAKNLYLLLFEDL